MCPRCNATLVIGRKGKMGCAVCDLVMEDWEASLDKLKRGVMAYTKNSIATDRIMKMVGKLFY